MSVINKGSTMFSMDGKDGVKSPLPSDIDDTKSRIGDEYVLIRKLVSEKGLSKPTLDYPGGPFNIKERAPDFKAAPVGALIADQKTDQNVKPLNSSMRRMIHLMATKSGKGKFKPTDIVMTVSYLIQNSAANTNATVLTLDPSNCLDWTSVSNLFDQAKTRKIVCRYDPSSQLSSVPTTGTGALTSHGMLSYDSSSSAAGTGIADLMDQPQRAKYLPAIVCGTAGVGNCTRTSKGCTLIAIPPPNIATISGALVDGDWFNTAGSLGSVATVGFLKWFEKNDLVINSYVGSLDLEFHMSFRCRD
jgi:hypothetical protein